MPPTKVPLSGMDGHLVSCPGYPRLLSLARENMNSLLAQRKASPCDHCCRAGHSRQHPAEDRAEPSTGIPSGGMAGQEGRRNPRNKEPRCTEVSSQGNRKKTNPKQISIALQCKCIQAPQGTSGSIQPPNEGFLPALLLPLLLPGATDHPQAAAVSLGPPLC